MNRMTHPNSVTCPDDVRRGDRLARSGARTVRRRRRAAAAVLIGALVVGAVTAGAEQLPSAGPQLAVSDGTSNT